MRGRKPSLPPRDDDENRVRLMPPPSYLTKNQKQIWNQLEPKIPNLVAAHTFVLADLCACLDMVQRLQKRVNNRVLIKGAKGQRKNPILQVLREYRQAVQRYATEFGLTPVSLIRLTGHAAGTDKAKPSHAGRGRDPDDPLNGRFHPNPELVN